MRIPLSRSHGLYQQLPLTKNFPSTTDRAGFTVTSLVLCSSLCDREETGSSLPSGAKVLALDSVLRQLHPVPSATSGRSRHRVEQGHYSQCPGLQPRSLSGAQTPPSHRNSTVKTVHDRESSGRNEKATPARCFQALSAAFLTQLA